MGDGVPCCGAEFMSFEFPQSAYVHVPFCLHKCGYCDFTVVAGRDDLIGAYLECLEQELKLQLGAPQPMQTVFLGGGTPSYLPAESLKTLVAMINRWLPVIEGGEFSMECNPELLTQDRMDVIRASGVNRISLGVQSFDAVHLKTLERSHSAETVVKVVEQLRDRGFSNLSLDLIFGVPGQSLQEWQSTLTAAMALEPQHLSTYGLTFEKGTSFWTRREKHQLQPVTEELERDMYGLAMSSLPLRGYQQYELSNFAKPGFASRHNQVYWRGESYFGIGPGAAGLYRGVRVLNHRSVTTWIRRLQAGKSAVQEREEFDPDLRRRLRQVAGIEIKEFQERHQLSVRELAPVAYQQLMDSGWLEETATHVRLTREGRFVADTVMSEFF